MKLNKHNQALHVDVEHEEWDYLKELDACQTVVNNDQGTTSHLIDIEAIMDDIQQHQPSMRTDAMETIYVYLEIMKDVGYTLIIIDL
jgi:hypothetical protein